MPLQIAFWVLILIWLVLWFVPTHSYVPNIVLFLIFIVLGWKVFGSPLAGG